MTYLQLKRYLQNDDLEITRSNRKFSDKDKDLYPIFSFCFSSSDRYFEFEFNSSVLARGYSLSLNKSSREIMKEDISEEDIFDIQLPGRTCLTKRVQYQHDVKFLYDKFEMNSSWLREQRITARLYIHRNGQLFRAFLDQEAEYTFDTNGYQKSGCIGFRYSDVRIVRRRHNSNVPCNDNLLDEDGYIMKLVMIKSKCIPKFWEQKANQYGLTKILPNCNISNKGYMGIAENTKQILQDIRNLNFEYGSCTEMKIKIVSDEIDQHCNSWEWFFNENLAIELYYTDDFYTDIVYKYTEVVYTQAYTIETLFGSVGGYVGR